MDPGPAAAASAEELVMNRKQRLEAALSEITPLLRDLIRIILEYERPLKPRFDRASAHTADVSQDNLSATRPKDWWGCVRGRGVMENGDYLVVTITSVQYQWAGHLAIGVICRYSMENMNHNSSLEAWSFSPYNNRQKKKGVDVGRETPLVLYDFGKVGDSLGMGLWEGKLYFFHRQKIFRLRCS